MIINLDDLNYTIISKVSRKYHTTSAEKFETIETALSSTELDWLLFLFSIYHLESRFLETESYLTTNSSYHLSVYRCPSSDWPEMEEKIRKDHHKCWYERRSGKKI